MSKVFEFRSGVRVVLPDYCIMVPFASPVWELPAAELRQALDDARASVAQAELIHWLVEARTGCSSWQDLDVAEHYLDELRAIETNELADENDVAFAAQIVAWYERAIQKWSPKRNPGGLRNVVIRRDGARCRYCGQSVAGRAAQIDHVVPYSLGGLTEESNLVTACPACNRRKSGRTPAQAGMALLPQP